MVVPKKIMVKTKKNAKQELRRNEQLCPICPYVPCGGHLGQRRQRVVFARPIGSRHKIKRHNEVSTTE